jgi:hypothetical protein
MKQTKGAPILVGNCPMPISKQTERAFRLWDADGKKHITGKRFSRAGRAMNNAIAEMQWPSSPRVIEVYDVATGAHIATYKRGANYIDIWRRRDLTKEKAHE